MATALTTTEPITKETYNKRGLAFIAALPPEERQKLPVITPSSPNFNEWRQYFQRHLGYTPLVLREILNGRRQEMTVPAMWPNWFDSSFVVDKTWQPSNEYAVTPRHLRPSADEIEQRIAHIRANTPQSRCNVFVPENFPNWHSCVEMHNVSGIGYFSTEMSSGEERYGIWVPLEWVSKAIPRVTGYKPLTDDELRAIYKKAETGVDNATP